MPRMRTVADTTLTSATRAINGDPERYRVRRPGTDRENDGDATYDHNIGVWYEGVNEKKWAIFNQDRAAIPGWGNLRGGRPASI